MREGGLGYVVILGLLWISVLFVLKGLPEGNKDYYLVLLLLVSMRDRLRQSRAYKEQVRHVGGGWGYVVALLLMNMRDRLRQSRAYKEQVRHTWEGGGGML